MLKPAHTSSPIDSTPGLQQFWLAEAIRLRESQWGPLHDDLEIRRSRNLKGDFSDRLLWRATQLGQREGIDTSIHQWMKGAKLAFIVLVLLALLTGGATALGALGDGSRQVNLVLALTALLGLHALTFLFWGISSLLPSGDTTASLGDLWLWLTRKIARGPQAVLVPRALAGMLSRQGALRPLLGSISHALWLSALGAMFIVLIALLAARRYTFSWETTLLSPDAFVRFTNVLGWLPSKLGFTVPPDTIIRASDGLQTLPEGAHALWSGWLIGCLVCYGLLPRALALVSTAFITMRRTKALRLDPHLPGYIELRERLEPGSLEGSIDAPAPAEPHTTRSTAQPSYHGEIQHAIAGVELAPDHPWPPATLIPSVTDLGIIDGRLQRQHVLNALQAATPRKLLIVCDGHQTPDRGTITLILELASLAEQARILLLDGGSGSTSQSVGTNAYPAPTVSGPDARNRLDTWQQQLQRAQISAETIHRDQAQAMTWLNSPVTDLTARDTASPS